MEIYVRVIIIIFMFHFGVIGLVGIKYAMNDNKTKKMQIELTSTYF